MKSHHFGRHSWIVPAAVAAAALFALGGAAGQSTGARAVFEGRPAMAGAQAGTGALAGPPQGGLGVQGNEGAQLNLRRPAGVAGAQEDMPQGTMADPPAALAVGPRPEGLLPAPGEGEPRVVPRDPGREAPRDEGRGREVLRDAPPQRDRDPGVSSPRSTADKVRRGAERTREASRFGVSPLDTR